MQKDGYVKRKRAMIVDDDTAFTSTLMDFLSSRQWECSVFSSAKESLQYNSEQPDVIIVDFELPDMDGTVLLRELIEKSEGSLGVIISANPAWEIRQKALEAGATFFFPKPIDLLFFEEKIKRIKPMKKTRNKKGKNHVQL